MSPVSSRGAPRVEIFSIFQQFVELVEKIKPEDWENCSQAAIAYSQRHQTAHFLVPAYRAMYDTARAFYKAGVDHSYHSLSRPGPPPKLLFYDGLDWLDKQAQENLVAYVENGGHLVVFQDYPTRDEHGRDCNLLGIPKPDGIDAQSYMTTFYMDYQVQLGDQNIPVTLPDGIYWYRQVPGEPIYASRGPTRDLNDAILNEYQFMAYQGCEDDLVVGYRETRGKGSLIVLGLAPTPELVVGLHDFLDIPIAARPQATGVQAVLYRREDKHYLIVINSGTEAKGVEIFLDRSELPDERYVAHNLLDSFEQPIVTYPDGRHVLFVNVDKKSGAIFEISVP